MNKLKRLKTYWHVFWKLRKIQLEILFEYRANFYLWTFISTMWTAFNIFFFAILVGVRGDIAGWNRQEIYLLTGIFTMLDAMTWSFFYHNMVKYTTSIFDGSLDLFLLKPIDSQFFVMTRGNSFNNVLRLLIGIFLTVWSAQKLQLNLNIMTIVLFLLTFFAALMLTYLIWFVIATLAMWFERLDNINEIVPELRRISQVPKDVYQGLTSTIFSVILPLTLTTTIPSEVLLGRLDWKWIIYLLAFTLLFFVFARKFYFYSIKKYSGVGQ